MLALQLCEVSLPFSQGLLLLLGLLSVGFLHLNELLLILDQGLGKSVNLVDHGLFLEFVCIASTLNMAKVLVLFSNVEK